MALTRVDLDAQTCVIPGCNHTAHEGLVLKAACHPRGATYVEYKAGVLTITCAKCSRFVTAIAVKDKPDYVSWGEKREKAPS